jgi:alpha-L-glutamate ligase-like protein
MTITELFENRKRVLGMNERNLAYVKVYNKGKSRRIADNKLLTKRILQKAGIPTPPLLGVLKNMASFREFDWDSLPRSFVIKPVSGSAGGGIEIFFNRDKEGNWIKGNGARYSLEEIQTLAADILDGKYSLHNEPDQVFFEERVKMHKAFQYFSYKGVPDIRVIVFNSLPVMAMLRLPTKESEGKGNLDKGAVGAGIDIATGVTTTAIIGKSESIEVIPGTRLNVSGLKIPYWDKILRFAIEASRASGLGFAGVDFLIDREKGPMIVELNARPGLSIQIANNDGLRWRLRKARGLKVQSVEKGVRLGKDLFGGAIEEDIERISGKDVVGIIENVILYPIEKEDKLKLDEALQKLNERVQKLTPEELDNLTKNSKKLAEIQTKAKIDTGADSTSVDESAAKNLGYVSLIQLFELVKMDLQVPDEILDTASALDYMQKVNQALVDLNLPIETYAVSVRSSHGRSLRLYTSIKMKLSDTIFETNVNLYNRENLTYKVIVGRKSLSKFLVEPSKNRK